MGKTRRQLSSWNRFVMDVKQQNPDKSFKEVLVLASKLKKQGKKVGDYVKNKTEKAVKKVRNSLNGKRRKSTKGRKGRKGRKSRRSSRKN